MIQDARGSLITDIFKTSRSRANVADALRSRGVRAVAYFHTDHFEPWRIVPLRDGGMARAGDDVARFMEMTERLDFARRSSLFYKPNVNYVVSAERDLRRAHPDDLLGFVPRGEQDLRIAKSILAPLVNGSDHEIQLHIHHEYFTYNDSDRDPETFRYLQTPQGRAFDDARLELAIRLSLDTFREDADYAPSRWFFIHGHWALNASDPHECTVVREIEMLKRNGCLGDFTQPSGRPHVDSRIDAPYLVEPVAAAKGYDRPEANPIEAAGAGASAADRFFIWASATAHDLCSIDTYSPFVQRRMKYPVQTAFNHAREGVVIDGVLYVKTHCHSMAPSYWNPDDGRKIPQADPGIRAELGELFEAADAIGAEVGFFTASEIYDRVIGARRPAPRDLAQACGLHVGSAMERIGVTVRHFDRAGRPADPPPLGPRPEHLAEPAPACVRPQTESGGAPAGPEVVAYIVPLDVAEIHAQPVAPDGAADAPMIRGAELLPTLMASREVRRINAAASGVAIMRSMELGSEGSGVTGFYGLRAAEGSLLQPLEVLCAEFVRARLPKARNAYEIGCGLGVLACLLELWGVKAVGIERNGARLATANAIAQVVKAEDPNGARAPQLLRGVFPKALLGTSGLARSVALVTNLLGTATPAQQQEFIDGLRAFGAVLIDVQRFYVRRSPGPQMDDLMAVFAAAGFDAPRLVCDLGSDGRLVLFTNPRPMRRNGVEKVMFRLGMIRDEPLLADA